MGTVASLWRYPIKSHGREALASVPLIAGQTIPWDCHWVVTRADTKFDYANPAWVMCRNFMIGNLTPDLAGIWATLDEATATVTLRHEALNEITFRPDDTVDVAQFIDWVMPICPADKRIPHAIAHIPGQGITDTDFPSVLIMDMASHAAVADKIDQPFEMERWRSNIWVDGFDAWSEWDWISNIVTIGNTILRVTAPVIRCNHTAANPRTGKRDVDTLRVLRDNLGSSEFWRLCRSHPRRYCPPWRHIESKLIWKPISLKHQHRNQMRLKKAVFCSQAKPTSSKGSWPWMACPTRTASRFALRVGQTLASQR